MSHHFDTPSAREDPRINLCDFYLFSGRPGTTVMAMTVNPNAGVSAPDTFRDEGVYGFRFDLDRDLREDVAFKVCFGDVLHPDGDETRHVQTFEVRRAEGDAAGRGWEGELILAGQTGTVIETGTGCRVFAGLAPDLFAGDAVALTAFRTALFEKGRFSPEAFLNRMDFFAGTNVTAIVLEVPSDAVGEGLVHGWATVSLHGHAPEIQVSRWGLPLVTHLFMPDPDMREAYNRAGPGEDVTRFSAQIGKVLDMLAGLAGTQAGPSDHAKRLVGRLCPTTLPYELGSTADFARFNGRDLADDVMDTMLTWATKTPLGDGVAPDRARIRREFPYFGEPYSKAEQDRTRPAAAVTR